MTGERANDVESTGHSGSGNSPPVPLRERTKEFALRVIRLSAALPQSPAALVIGKQLLRSGTSVGAQYREAVRSRSAAEFISKLQIGLQELDETSYWLELLAGSKLMSVRRLAGLQRETDELTAILVTCINTAKKNKRKTDT